MGGYSFNRKKLKKW